MSKPVKNNTVFFLVAVLVAGIIAISYPSSSIDTEASGDKRDKNKHKDYKHDTFKSKNPSVFVKKITCNNFNVNINGLRMDLSPDDLASDLAAQAQAANSNDEEISANSLANGERNNFLENNNDYDGFIYICIDNINAQGPSAPSPTPPSDETPSDETPSDETPSDETPSDETPSDETPSDETPSDATPSDETPSDETPSDETQSDETPSDETPSDETPSEGTPYPPTPPSTETPDEDTPYLPTPPSTETPSDETSPTPEETLTKLKNFLAKIRS